MSWYCRLCEAPNIGQLLKPTISLIYRHGTCWRCGKTTLFTESEPRAVARNTDPLTSHMAAASVRNIRASQQQVLDTLRDIGQGTDEDIAAHLKSCGLAFSPSGARTRRSELATLGLVADTGMRRKLRSGRLAIVWAATRQGL